MKKPTIAIVAIGVLTERLASLDAANANVSANASAGAIAGQFAELQKQARDEDEGARQQRRARLAAIALETADDGAPLPNGFPDDAARLATLMRNSPKIQLAFFALGGWDTHANQGAGSGQLANRLAPLAQRLGPLFDDTTVVVMSEFGRTARENGNGGTDHGHGNVMWVMGGNVAGGKVYGDWQGLGDAALNENRDLPVTTDFRWVLAHVAKRHLKLNDRQLADVFPAMPQRGLGFQLLRG